MRTSNSEEQQTQKEIKSGKYRGAFLIYNRRSTDDTDNQKNSIAYQKAENMRFAYREHLPIAALSLPGFATDGIVSERHSGFAEGLELSFGSDHTVRYRVERPKFHRLVSWLSEGHFRGVIFLCWDRASRNKGDDTILRKLIKSGVDIRFTLAQYDKSSAGELHMDIDGMFAEHHSRVTREKVMLAQQSARARGLVTHKAPVGYLNLGSMEHKPPDPQRAPIVRRVFELAATGTWSLADLARFATAQGFTMPPIRRRRTADEKLAEDEDDVRLSVTPVARLATANTIHQMLANPFYTGKTRNGDGAWVKSASHEPLISEELYARVQEAIRLRRTSAHYAALLELPFRGMVRCALCGRVYTPYEQKRITYYGARCSRTCPNPKRNVSLVFIEREVGNLVSRLCLTQAEAAELDARADAADHSRKTEEDRTREDAERRAKALREDLAYLSTNRLALLRAGAYTADALVAEEARLKREIEAMERTEDETTLPETARAVVKLSELLKNVAAYYEIAKPMAKERIARTIFSELTLSQNTLLYQCKDGFEVLQSRFVGDSAPNTWLSELPKYRDSIVTSRNELAELMRAQSSQTPSLRVDCDLDSTIPPGGARFDRPVWRGA